jgi:RND superfamily putative drug exporter
MLGLGIALAVLMDAMIVRSLLVPAAMKLTGRATWWAPTRLRRFHDRFGLREAEDERPFRGAGNCATSHNGPADKNGDGSSNESGGVRAIR